MMNKRFLTCACAALLAVGVSSCVKNKVQLKQEQNQPVQEDQNISNLLTLTSTPDEGTEYNEILARKARKVAAYILDNSDSTYVCETGVSHGVKRPFVIEKYGYNPEVFINNPDSEPEQYTLQFFMFDTEYSEKEARFSFDDNGLDGRANSASLTYSAYDCGESDEEGKFFDLSEKKGLEHQGSFQQKYEEALDVLLNFYEQKAQQSK